jgi:hypothetical protein
VHGERLLLALADGLAVVVGVESCGSASADCFACPDTELFADGEPDGEPVGDPVGVELEGVGDGVVLEGVGDALADCVGVLLADALDVGEGVRQLSGAWADPRGPGLLDSVLPPACEPFCADECALVLEPGPPKLCESSAGLNCWGSAAIAQDAPVTTRRPGAAAAAGRSHPNQPTRSSSGRNRSATAPVQ